MHLNVSFITKEMVCDRFIELWFFGNDFKKDILDHEIEFIFTNL